MPNQQMKDQVTLVERLMETSERQVKFSVLDCLRHCASEMGVNTDHPSQGVIKDELKQRLSKVLNEL